MLQVAFSFDDLRENIANEFNRLANSALDQEQAEALDDLREHLTTLLALEDPETEEDFSDLTERVSLAEVEYPEDEDSDVGDGQ